jgi:hypothetical protein
MCQLACGAVNAAGTSYSVDAAGNIVVAACPQDTYGPGMKKQRSCVPCPPGYTTNGATGQTTAAACGESWSCATPLAASRLSCCFLPGDQTCFEMLGWQGAAEQ